MFARAVLYGLPAALLIWFYFASILETKWPWKLFYWITGHTPPGCIVGFLMLFVVIPLVPGLIYLTGLNMAMKQDKKVTGPDGDDKKIE